MLKEKQKFQQIHGQVFTQPEVIKFVLRAQGITDKSPITEIHALEPSCGSGEFVAAFLEILLSQTPPVDQLIDKIQAFEIDTNLLKIAIYRAKTILTQKGYSSSDAEKLTDNWFINADFLLFPVSKKFTHIFGNPPYVRIENIDKSKLSVYRELFSTMTERSDIYIPFYEKSLRLLADDGRLSFVCTDRWMKNSYGKSLRKFISENFSLEMCVSLTNAEAFQQDVLTYPSITQIVKKKETETIFIHNDAINEKLAAEVYSHFFENIKIKSGNFRRIFINSDSPWLAINQDEKYLLTQLEANCSLLEEAGCSVHIGTATGANEVFIVPSFLDIEESRLLPAVTAKEIKNGVICWEGNYIINTHDDNGIIQLSNYPKLATYLYYHKDKLANRHVAKKDPAKWFKTIDKINIERRKKEKLMIPDIGNKLTVIYDDGKFQPTNSIYYICSTEWNLHALRVLLLSKVGEFFIQMYSTKIANNYRRHQAQFLRRIRIPNWSDLSCSLKDELIKAGKTNAAAQFDNLACKAYRLTSDQFSTIERNIT